MQLQTLQTLQTLQELMFFDNLKSVQAAEDHGLEQQKAWGVLMQSDALYNWLLSQIMHVEKLFETWLLGPLQSCIIRSKQIAE